MNYKGILAAGILAMNFVHFKPAMGREVYPLPAKTVSDVETSIRQMMNEDQIPGLAISIVAIDDRGRFYVHNQGFGVAGVKSDGTIDNLVHEDTLFRVASISKSFTAIALTKQLTKGCLKDLSGNPVDFSTRILDIDTPFAQTLRKHYLAGTLRDNAYWNQVTLDLLLQHRSGLEIEPVGRDRWADYNLLARSGHEMTDGEFDAQIQKMGFAYPPDQIPADAGIKYSNLGFNIIGRILGEACGTKSLANPSARFQSVVEKEIISPLGMRDALYNLPRTAVAMAKHARGFSNERLIGDGPLKNETWYLGRIQTPHIFEPDSYSPSAGLALSSRDMSLMLKGYLQALKTGTSPLASWSQLEKLLAPHAADGENRVWGRGLLWHDYGPSIPIAFGHTGTDSSHRTIFLIFPELGVGVAVLLNAYDADREKYAYGILSMLQKDGIGTSYSMPAPLQSLIDQVHTLENAYVPNPQPTPVAAPSNTAPPPVQPLLGWFQSRMINDIHVVYTTNGTLAADLGSGLEELTSRPNSQPRCELDKTLYILPTFDFYHGDALRYDCNKKGGVRRLIIANGSYFY